MTIELGWDLVVLAGAIGAALVALGAICEYVWLAIHHRRP
jgi:hypothetical protein